MTDDEKIRKMAFGGDVKPPHYETKMETGGGTVNTANGPVQIPAFMADGGDVETPYDYQLQPGDITKKSPIEQGLANLPATAAPAPTTAMPPAATPTPAAGAPALPTGGTSLTGEMGAAEKLLGSSPDQRNALMAALGKYKQQGQVGAGIAGIGDAIASGATLGKVNPHGLENVENRLEGNEKLALANSDVNFSRQQKAYEIAKEQEGRDPNSHFSRAYAAAANKVLGPHGIKIPAGMSAMQLEQMLGPTATIVDAQARMEIQKNESEHRIAVEKENAVTKENEAQTTAAEDIVKGYHPFLPGGPSRAQQNNAVNALVENAGGASSQSPDDQKAIEWARANPADPRAAKILSLHGMK